MRRHRRRAHLTYSRSLVTRTIYQGNQQGFGGARTNGALRPAISAGARAAPKGAGPGSAILLTSWPASGINRCSLAVTIVIWWAASPSAIFCEVCRLPLHMTGLLRKLLLGVKRQSVRPRPLNSSASSPNGLPEDRRAARRYPLRLPASLSFTYSRLPESVCTNDINQHGLSLHSSYPIPVGASIDIVVHMPTSILCPEQRRVHYRASVVRVEEDVVQERFRIAAVIKNCEVLPAVRKLHGTGRGSWYCELSRQ